MRCKRVEGKNKQVRVGYRKDLLGGGEGWGGRGRKVGDQKVSLRNIRDAVECVRWSFL